jgi:hypothetical protein
MKVVTVRNGFIIVALLALGGALSAVGNQGWFGTDPASAASPQEKTQARNDLNVVMASLRSIASRAEIVGATLFQADLACSNLVWASAALPEV